MESDSFYYALPLPLDEFSYKSMYRTENYITERTDSKVQTIAFDCAVVVNPSEDQILNLKKAIGDDINIRNDIDKSTIISAKHSEAVRCMIESKGIRTLEATGQFISFVSEKRIWNLNVRKDSIPDWKYIFYKEGKEPLILPSLMLTVEDVEQYFGGAK